jgi:poly-gamma-glutamate capsule biosynthesis protein CapA/YwtB (metallophosphatase superfamily)
MTKRRVALVIILIMLIGMGLWMGNPARQPGEMNPGPVEPGVSPQPVYASPQAAAPVDEEALRIVAVGDIMLGRGVTESLKMKGLGFSEPFADVQGLLKAGDVVFCNLEHPLTESEYSLDPNSKYVLRAAPEAAEGLEWAGFNLVSIANNHILDYYEAGLADTMAILEERDIAFAGSGENLEKARQMAVLEVNGKKIGLLAYTEFGDVLYEGDPPLRFTAWADKAGVAPLDTRLIKEDMAKAREQVDLLIVSLHWGVEDSFGVTDQQISLAHWLVEQGADIILGHHPHWFQGIELYRGKPIVYSLGNFIFDQPLPQSKESFILDFTYSQGVLSGLKAYPVGMTDRTQVTLLGGTDAVKLMEREIRLCNELGTSCQIVDGCLVFAINN